MVNMGTAMPTQVVGETTIYSRVFDKARFEEILASKPGFTDMVQALIATEGVVIDEGGEERRVTVAMITAEGVMMLSHLNIEERCSDVFAGALLINGKFYMNSANIIKCPVADDTDISDYVVNEVSMLTEALGYNAAVESIGEGHRKLVAIFGFAAD